MKRYLAIDIGASSGRHIVGWAAEGGIETCEVYRFPNAMTEVGGHLCWDAARLLTEVKAGIAAAVARFGRIESLSIDTWGVDYVLLRGDEPVLPVFAYRDSRTETAVAAVHAALPFSELYRRTGCQFQPFNSIYQLTADRLAGRLTGVTDWLMMPEYLLWRLCGQKVREYTNATTSGLVSAATGEFDPSIIDCLSLPSALFPTLTRPGALLGEYAGIPVRLGATHDTASAVEGIPMKGNALYISSGTWSLLGVRLPRPLTGEAARQSNFTNEGGLGYVRFQKNIMGMWLSSELRRELCPQHSHDEIIAAAERSRFDGLIDAESPAFLSPESMKSAFDNALTAAPQDAGDYFRCAYRSLAVGYARAIDELERIVGTAYDRLYIVGGGARNAFLNRLTAEATGKQVIALPMEATALGNLKLQMEAD